jgi:hypothetical protein
MKNSQKKMRRQPKQNDWKLFAFETSESNVLRGSAVNMSSQKVTEAPQKVPSAGQNVALEPQKVD